MPVESPARRKPHTGFGGRLAETEQPKGCHRAAGRPYLYALESRFAVWLCNARAVKKVPGRKTDLTDAEWLSDVAAHGMVRPSFVPPPPIRELRELTRYRKTQSDVRAAEIQRLEKVLQDAGIKLTSVASKVLTQSGRAMIEALIARRARRGQAR
jgi:transposase